MKVLTCVLTVLLLSINSQAGFAGGHVVVMAAISNSHRHSSSNHKMCAEILNYNGEFYKPANLYLKLNFTEQLTWK